MSSDDPIPYKTPCPGAALQRVLDGAYSSSAIIDASHPVIAESISVLRILGAYFQGVADYSDRDTVVDSAVAYGELCGRLATKWEDLL
jgi:hypothetical protein